VLRSQISLPDWYSLVPIQPKGERVPLFMVHSLNHRDFYHHLGTDRPIYGLHYGIADRSDRVPDLPTIEDLAAQYIKEMCEVQPHGPYYLMGHSFGGAIAYEMSRQLVAQGLEVGLTALFNTNLDLQNRQSLSLTQKIANFQQLGLAELIDRAKHRLQFKFNLLKDRYGSSGLAHEDIFIEDPRILSAMNKYTPQPYSGRVVLFKAINPLPMLNYSVSEPEVILNKLVTGGIKIYEVSGNNNTILQQPNVSIVAEAIETYLRNSEAWGVSKPFLSRSNMPMVDF
jgi:thioesterase domain-containing protein